MARQGGAEGLLYEGWHSHINLLWRKADDVTGVCCPEPPFFGHSPSSKQAVSPRTPRILHCRTDARRSALEQATRGGHQREVGDEDDGGSELGTGVGCLTGDRLDLT